MALLREKPLEGSIYRSKGDYRTFSNQAMNGQCDVTSGKRMLKSPSPKGFISCSVSIAGSLPTCFFLSFPGSTRN